MSSLFVAISGSRPTAIAAVNSMASGRPSTRRQISPTSSTARSFSSDAFVLAPARSRNRRTAAHASISERFAPAPATGNGASRWFNSSTTHKGSRLVASTWRRGSRAVSSSTSWATADTTCSQLSSTSKRSRSASHWVSASTFDSPPGRDALGDLADLAVSPNQPTRSNGGGLRTHPLDCRLPRGLFVADRHVPILPFRRDLSLSSQRNRSKLAWNWHLRRSGSWTTVLRRPAADGLLARTHQISSGLTFQDTG